ncbi:TupA-like ATPgrasp protein [Comamonadaceae bacterium]
MIKSAYRILIENIPAKLSLIVQYIRHHHIFPNIKTPRSFNEKILARKLSNQYLELFVRLADKVAVKEYVKDILGESLIIPTLWSGSSPPPFEVLEKIQSKFVVKSNHASGWNYFSQNDGGFDYKEISNLCNQWLNTEWHPELGEWWYNKIEREIIVEPFINEIDTSLTDYKVFVFGGRAEFIQVDTDRFTTHKRDYYDLNWNLLPFRVEHDNANIRTPRPKFLKEILSGAELLAKPFDFCRVDFYELADGPKFGEMTFAPGAGHERFFPKQYDFEIGTKWNILSRESSAR